MFSFPKKSNQDSFINNDKLYKIVKNREVDNF